MQRIVITRIALKLVAASFLFALGTAKTGFAWGDLGHETVAEIAARNIRPQTARFVDHYLKQSLALAAVAPDKVKSDPFFTGRTSFNKYHYVNFIGVDANGEVLLGTKGRSALVLLESATKILSGAGKGAFDDYQKKLLLQYAIHVVGDLQQPLHIGYAHDKGGNTCQVNFLHPYFKKEIPTNLHAVWDTDILETYARIEFYDTNPKTKWFGYKELADSLEAEVKKHKGTAKVVAINAWMADSAALHDRVYPKVKSGRQYHAKLAGTFRVNAYCDFEPKASGGKGASVSAVQAAIPTIGTEYSKKALPIIKDRLALGGLRLAAYLDDLARQGCKEHPAVCRRGKQNRRKSSIKQLWKSLKD